MRVVRSSGTPSVSFRCTWTSRRSASPASRSGRRRKSRPSSSRSGCATRAPPRSELHQRGWLGDAERGGERVPAEGPGEQMRAGAEKDHRRGRRAPPPPPAPLHRGRPAASARRRRGAAPRRGRRARPPGENARRGQRPRCWSLPTPDAARSVLGAVKPGTAVLLVAVHRPGNPGTERGRNVPRGQRLGARPREAGPAATARGRDAPGDTSVGRTEERIDGLLEIQWPTKRRADFAWSLGETRSPWACGPPGRTSGTSAVGGSPHTLTLRLESVHIGGRNRSPVAFETRKRVAPSSVEVRFLRANCGPVTTAPTRARRNPRILLARRPSGGFSPARRRKFMKFTRRTMLRGSAAGGALLALRPRAWRGQTLASPRRVRQVRPASPRPRTHRDSGRRAPGHQRVRPADSTSTRSRPRVPPERFTPTTRAAARNSGATRT